MSKETTPDQDKLMAQRQRALDAAMLQIQKDFGETAIMRLGDRKTMEVEVVRTGNLLIDRALGVGGFPRGRIVEVFGPESSGKTTLTLTVIAQAQKAGGLAAFLIYNFHPAKVFMGDTGSLFLGGAVCGMAFALNIPLVIPVIGLVYVLEVLSDIIQVVYFKKTGGKRFFRMAPLHHHLEMGGWSEVKLFCVFSGGTFLLCALAFVGVMNRYPM